MANTFDEQAKERFQKSLAFMHKAEALLQDDLIYRSALADSVSAIKNMLQGYLLFRVAQMPPSAVSQRWQEIAISNRMPELIATCGEAGLDLRGLAVEIKRLNNERNNRAHDDPQQRIDPEQAQRAAELARVLQKRIKLANEGKTDTRTIAQRAAEAVEVVRGAVSGQLKPVAGSAPATRAQAASETASTRAASSSVAIATPTSPTPPVSPPSPPGASSPRTSSDVTRAETPSAVANGGTAETVVTGTDAMRALDDSPASGDDGDRGGDSSELPAISRRGRSRGRRRGPFARIVTIAAVLILGIAAGVGAAVPVSRGDAPDWLNFTKGWFAPNAAPTVAVTPTATEPVVSGATEIGNVAIGAPSCANGVISVTLTNLGTAPANWATGSPDADNAMFGTSATAATQPTLTGTLAAGKQVTLYVAGPALGTAYHISVVASGGAVQLLVRSC